ncbi:MAG: N-acetyltransferase [Candidatus Aureabacteria bacterium]|nr:N-acetyltransferase [Candidatus Auribacterota bacterium]
MDSISSLINNPSEKDFLLSFPLEKICANIRDFFVAVEKKKVVGCAALHIYSCNLAELRSLVVHCSRRKQGIGALLAKSTLKEAEKLGLTRIFALTQAVHFFNALDFKEVQKESLPEKVYKDCIYCSKLHNCIEVAMIKLL